MHITDYEKVKDLVANNVFLLDGPNGTQSILAADLLAALSKITPTKDLIDTLNLDEMLQARTIELPDKFLMQIDSEKKIKTIMANDLYFMLADAIGLRAKMSIARVKNLGSVITEKQKNEIKNGTFRDMFLGDYWEIGGRKWQIVDFNTFRWYPYDSSIHSMNNDPHLVIMPTTELFTTSLIDQSASNYTDIYKMGYQGIRSNGDHYSDALRGICDATFGSGFTDHHYYTDTITQGVDQKTGYPRSLATHSANVELPSISHIFGTMELGYAEDTITHISNDLATSRIRTAFSLFAIDTRYFLPEEPYERKVYWTRDTLGEIGYCCIGVDLDVTPHNALQSNEYKPFLLYTGNP